MKPLNALQIEMGKDPGPTRQKVPCTWLKHLGAPYAMLAMSPITARGKRYVSMAVKEPNHLPKSEHWTRVLWILRARTEKRAHVPKNELALSKIGHRAFLRQTWYVLSLIRHGTLG